MDRIAQEFPQDEYLKKLFVPLTRAVADLHAGKAQAAIENLRLLESFDRGDNALMRPSYYAGLAELALRSGTEARRAFQKIIDNRGVISTSPLFVLAHLGLARAAALDGPRAGAIAAYDKFFDLWKDADSDLPILKQARAEYAKLRNLS
jgi:hypothetical protein